MFWSCVQPRSRQMSAATWGGQSSGGRLDGGGIDGHHLFCDNAATAHGWQLYDTAAVGVHDLDAEAGGADEKARLHLFQAQSDDFQGPLLAQPLFPVSVQKAKG